MYTVNFYELTLENTISLSPYLIEDISEQSYGFESRKQMGLVFEDPSDAMEKAREIFWNNYYRSMAEYPSEECNIANIYIVGRERIEQLVQTNPTYNTKAFFKSKEDALNALNRVGIKNFVKYVLKLNGQKVYEEVKY